MQIVSSFIYILKMINIVEFLKTTCPEVLTEEQVIQFGKNNKDAKFNQCVILGGGPGSGKGFIARNKLMYDYKTFNVDDLKKLYMKQVKSGNIDDREYDLSNEKDVSDLHYKVRDKMWKQRERVRFFKDKEAGSERLPNILFDMTADEASSIDAAVLKMFSYRGTNDTEDTAPAVVDLGYKITFVWVVSNEEIAAQNNMKRARRVNSDLLHKLHQRCNEFIPKLLSGEYPEISKYIDDVWIAYSAGAGRELIGKYKESPVKHLKKLDDTTFDYESVKADVEEFQHLDLPKK